VGIMRTIREVPVEDTSDKDGGRGDDPSVSSGPDDAEGAGASAGIAVSEEWSENNSKDIGQGVEWSAEDVIELVDD